MNLSFYISVTDFGSGNNFQTAPDLTKEINNHLSEKSYGESVENLAIGFIMALSRPGYEDWYRPKRISYLEHKDVKSKLTGETIEKRKLLSFEIRLEEDQIGSFLKGSDSKSKELLLEKTIDYLRNLKKLPSKVADFNLNHLIEDLESYKNKLSLQ